MKRFHKLIIKINFNNNFFNGNFFMKKSTDISAPYYILNCFRQHWPLKMQRI